MLVTGCEGGSTGSGSGGVVAINSVQEARILSVLDRLPEIDRRYVAKHATLIEDYHRTSANVPSRTIHIGPTFRNYTDSWAATTLVHEACHIERNHIQTSPARERECIRRQAKALDRMGNDYERDWALALTGNHCKQVGAC